MKKILFLLGSTLTFTVLQAQSVEQGAQHLYYERYPSAEKNYSELLQQQPANGMAWFGLVKTYLEQKQSDKAVNSIRQAPATLVNDPWFAVAYGAAMLDKNRDSAAMFFQAALKETKEKDAAILSSVAWAHINAKNGDIKYAQDLLHKAMKRDKRNAVLHVLMGDSYRKLNDGSEAYKAYSEALKLDEKHAAAYHKMGEIFLTQKNAEMFVANFNKAIAADANYAPSLYQLYAYYFSKDPARALTYYQSYLRNADANSRTEYELADLLYLNKQYSQAIEKAAKLLASHGKDAKARLHKLVAYSYAAQKDSAQALSAMNKYFAIEHDSNVIARDFEMIADLLMAHGQIDSAANYLTAAVEREKDSQVLYGYYRKLADLATEQKDFSAEAKWTGKYFTGNEKATNVDLFKWALAHYRAGEHNMADSVFGIYIGKYPDQSFGYYWQARSRAAMDTDMENGLAIPAYKQLVEVLAKNTSDPNYEKWMVEAYGYLAAYEANTEKDYPEAITYFEKVLEVDPENEDAKKYISILEKNASPGK